MTPFFESWDVVGDSHVLILSKLVDGLYLSVHVWGEPSNHLKLYGKDQLFFLDRIDYSSMEEYIRSYVEHRINELKKFLN